jgi:hypothetical protein
MRIFTVGGAGQDLTEDPTSLCGESVQRQGISINIINILPRRVGCYQIYFVSPSAVQGIEVPRMRP